MPTLNIPPKARFALYLLSAVGSVVAAYLFAKGLVGEAETGLWAGIVAIINAIAASKTDTAPAAGAGKRILGKAVMSPSDPRPTDRGTGNVTLVLLVVIALGVLLLLLGFGASVNVR